MKKKILLTVVLLLNLVVTILAMGRYWKHEPSKGSIDGCRRVSLNEIATLWIPEDYIYSTNEREFFLTDKFLSEDGYKLYIYGTYFDANAKRGMSFPGMEIQYVKTLSQEKIEGTYLIYGIDTLKVNGQSREIGYILFPEKTPIKLYGFDPKIDKDFLVEMAEHTYYSHINVVRENVIKIGVVTLIIDLLCYIYIKRKYPYEIDTHLKMKD